MKITKFLYRPRHWLLLVVAALLVAEGGVRALGLVDFALYEANAQIGYIPAANQHGSFLNKNDWQFNALHMGVPAFAPNPKRGRYPFPEKRGRYPFPIFDALAVN